MEIKLFFEEMYQSQINQSLTQYVLDNWDMGLSFLDNKHENMDYVIQLANQCINANNKTIYDNYVNGLLVRKGVEI